MRNFEGWLSDFRDSIANYRYFIDFEKVYEMANKKRAELFLLNLLIGSKNIKKEFCDLISRFPTAIAAVPILLAVRENEIYAKDEETGGLYHFDGMQHSIEDYCIFMEKTGLFDLIQNHIVNNLFDYVIGVETGLNSNARKNRGGYLMENLVEGFLVRAGVKYKKEMYSHEIQSLYNIDLSALTNNGETEKRFDFVVPTANCVYGIEANFYRSGGSKLNETARSYKLLAQEAEKVPNFKFVWFTDGTGWKTARQNLKEAFDVIPMLFNIKELESGIAERIFV